MKAQAALEYVITYGWALVAIATTIGIAVFLVGGNINTNTCTTFTALLCKGVQADGDQLMLVLQNATGQKITISPFTNIAFGTEYGYGKILFQGEEHILGEVTIGQGEEFIIIGQGVVLEDEITITYYEEQTGITRTVSSTIGTDAPDDIEIGNDGIDNDGDGLTDCEETEIEGCRYVIEDGNVNNATNDLLIIFDTAKLVGLGPVKEETFVFYVKDGIDLPEYEVHVCTQTPFVSCVAPINKLEAKSGWNYYVPKTFPSPGEIRNPIWLDIRDGSSMNISEDPGFEPKMIIEME